MLELGGFPVAEEDALQLVVLLYRAAYVRTADRVASALTRGRREVCLTIDDERAILDVLEDTPKSLAPLRGVVAADYLCRIRDELA